MAYPAFVATPWVYGVNFHAQDLRQHATPDRVRFGAASDADATALAALYAGASHGQQTTLTKRLGEHNVSVDHPTGTLYTARAVLVDANGAAVTVRLRNFNAATATAAELAALFAGTAAGAVTALSAPPTIIPSGNPVNTVTVTIVDRS